MESYTPPIPPLEGVSDSEPQKKKLRPVFELFKKSEFIPEPQQKAAPERCRRLAAEIMNIMRGEKKSEAVQFAVSPESLPQPLPIVERAKGMGRSVLRLIRRAQTEVQTADRRNTVAHPTNIDSLTEADGDVRAAMQELIAPIEAYQVNSATEALTKSQNTPSLEVPDSNDALELAAMTSESKSPLTRTIEAATAIATGTAREALSVKERLQKRTRIMRKVGLLALGAATVGGFVYTWRRMHELKKEQRRMYREHKKFEAEVRMSQQQEVRQLHRLEQTKIQKLSQSERQEYVEQVSQFAHQQAAEIRTAAHSQELLQAPSDSPDREGVLLGEQPLQSTEQRALQPEQARFFERLNDAVDIQSNSQAKSNIVDRMLSAGSQLASAITGKKADVPPSDSMQPLIAPKKQMHCWPVFVAFCVAIFFFIVSIVSDL